MRLSNVVRNPRLYLSRGLNAAAAYLNLWQLGMLSTTPKSPKLDESPEFDVVITWINDQDPEWHRSRTAFAPSMDKKLNPASRYFEFDSLRHCLRSIRMNLRGYRKIFILTNSKHLFPFAADPDLHAVTHSEVFGSDGLLPTFNSIAIEACMAKIPGLGERFVYFNDDFFVTAPTGPEDFFRYGRPRYRLCRRPVLMLDDFLAGGGNAIAERNAVRLLKDKLGCRPHFFKTAHAPVPFLKSHWLAAERDFPQAFVENRRSRFRSKRCVALSNFLVPYLALARGEASLATIDWTMRAEVKIHANIGNQPDRFLSAMKRAVPFANVNDCAADKASAEERSAMTRGVNACLERLWHATCK